MAIAFVVDHWVDSRAIDMTGQVINGCRVLERVDGVDRNARWRVIAACGHEALLTRDDLMWRVRHGCKDYFCRACVALHRRKGGTNGKTCKKCGKHRMFRNYHRRSDSSDGYQSRCKFCNKNGAETDRVAQPIECQECCDQPWRRPMGGCKCGGSHEPEDMRTMRYHVMTNNAGRWVMPNNDV